MKNNICTLLLIVALHFSISPFPMVQAADPKLGEINDGAAFLAGESLPEETDHPLTKLATWQSHRAELNRDFQSHLDRVLTPMSTWSTTEISPAQSPGATIRYLFSGPDILHALHMFPTAGTYILCGLEPVGVAPDITRLNTDNTTRALGEMRHALAEIIQFNFFRTKDMKNDLQSVVFPGTTPVMMVFLVKSGQYIREVEFLRLGKDGTLTSLGLDSKGADGVRIVFSPLASDQTKTLFYFSSDLSNGGFDTSGFGTWLETQPDGSAYLKAASYLLHNDWFSKVRDHLLAHSVQIVEDDSGIPYRRFDQTLWTPTLYGVYNGPISLFAQDYQADLVAAYHAASHPLPFGTGYKWRKGESTLMRFVRKDLPAQPASNVTEPAAATPVANPGLRAEPVVPAEPEKPAEPVN